MSSVRPRTKEDPLICVACKLPITEEFPSEHDCISRLSPEDLRKLENELIANVGK